MNCRTFRERLPDLFDRKPADGALQEHAQSCPQCASEWRQLEQLLQSLAPETQFRASPGFTERVMQQARQSPARRFRLGWLAAAAAAVVVLVPVWQTVSPDRDVSGASLLAQSVAALSDLRSMHMTGYMRSGAAEPFEFIDLNAAPVPLTIWKDFGQPERWRIEKPGRVVVNNGREALLLIRDTMASRGTPNAGFVEWLRPLLRPDHVLGDELVNINRGGAAAAVEENGTAVTLTVRRPAAGGEASNWLRNKLIVDSDHTCRYSFDRRTKRLTGLTVTVHAAGRDVEVLALHAIRYNVPVDPAVFQLAIPENVTWSVATSEMPSGARLPTSAKETAEVFFDALARRDWSAVLTVYPASDVPASLRNTFGGLELISLGEPFQVPIYGGWFVPYEIKFANGGSKRWKLAVRNDNPQGRWKVDGGY